MRYRKIVFLVTVLISVVALLFALWQGLVADRFVVPTDSMTPTLLPGDRIVVDKTLFGARVYKEFDFSEGKPLRSFRTRGRRKIKRNDILVFNIPWDGERIRFRINKVYVKRCVGLPGDSIEIKNGFIKNNNHKGILGNKDVQQSLAGTPDSLLEESVLHAFPFDVRHHNWTIKKFGPLYIPRKGDVVGLDSLNYMLYDRVIEYETGMKVTKDKLGRILIGGEMRKHYRFRENYYFMCGDNVLNSCDARYWGFTPEEFIVGVVVRVAYSREPATDRFRKERLWRNLK